MHEGVQRGRIGLPRRVFAGRSRVAVIVPQPSSAPDRETARAITDFVTLQRAEAAELALELGAPVRFLDADPGKGPRWLIGPAVYNPNLVSCRLSDEGQAGHWFDRVVAPAPYAADAPDLPLLAADRDW